MRLLAAPSRLRIAGCAVAVLLSLPPYSPVLVALLDGFPKSWCALQHPTFSRSPALGPFRFAHADSALSWIVAGRPMVCPLCLGLLVPWVGCLVLVSLEPVCACLQHPSRTGFPLPDVITPCCKSSLHFGQTIRASSGWWCSQARWTWNVAGVRCGCTLRQRLLPGFGCLVCGSLISDVRLTCSTRKVQGSRQKVAQVFGRHVACNPDAFCWLAVPVARGQPVVANAVTAPLSCEGWLACSAFLWQCQLMPSACWCTWHFAKFAFFSIL